MAKLVLIAVLVPVLAAGGLLSALLACALRRWALAQRLAFVSLLTALAGFALVFWVSLGVWSTPGATPVILPGAALDPRLDPTDKARALAESISLLMNSAALASLVALGGGAVWLLIRWRLRLAEKSQTARAA